jgi:hypothetical protein
MSLDLKTAIPWVLTLITLSVGIWQYVDKAAQANREPFLRQQLALAVETSEVVATLATTTDPAAFETARARFWVLYWGPLAFVEDWNVETSMVAIGKAVPEPGTPVPPLPLSALEVPSLNLAHALRDLSLDAWNADLGGVDLRGREN